jgi:hypothetical protein
VADCKCNSYGRFDTGYSRNRSYSLGIPGIAVLTQGGYGATGLAVLVNRRRRGYGQDGGMKDTSTGNRGGFVSSGSNTGNVITSVSSDVKESILAIFGARQPDSAAMLPPAPPPAQGPSLVGPAILVGGLVALGIGVYAFRGSPAK